MKIDILTIFPKMFENVFSESMIRIAKEKKLVDINIYDIRDWTKNKHKTVDDKPYGGGSGMIMKVEPIDQAINDLIGKNNSTKSKVILLTPQGEIFKQGLAKEILDYSHLVFVCGHYEGFDERIRKLVDMEITIGDYILTGGEIPAMVLTDALVRLIPGVLGDSNCIVQESFENGLLEYPQYTRPFEYKGMKVPDVLLSGDPKKINAWQEEESIKRTKKRRPDLLKETLKIDI